MLRKGRVSHCTVDIMLTWIVFIRYDLTIYYVIIAIYNLFSIFVHLFTHTIFSFFICLIGYDVCSVAEKKWNCGLGQWEYVKLKWGRFWSFYWWIRIFLLKWHLIHSQWDGMSLLFVHSDTPPSYKNSKL